MKKFKSVRFGIASDHSSVRRVFKCLDGLFRQKKWMVSLGIGLVIMGLPSHAMAMHITEGILPLQWAGLW